MAELETLSLDGLDLVEVTQSDTDTGVSVNVPFSSAFPATTGLEIGRDDSLPRAATIRHGYDTVTGNA